MRVLVSVIFVVSVILGLTACGTLGERRFETYGNALTPGIYLEPETRAVIPEGFELRSVEPKGIDLTKVSEGFRNWLYNDAASYCTIGYGHLIKKASCDGSEPVEFRYGISEPHGEELLVEDMGWAQFTVMRMVDIDLTEGQYAALVDFVFNVGSGNFRNSTLLKVLNQRQLDGVPFQFRRWVKAGGRVWPGLETRREREIELFFDGVGIPRAAPEEDEDLSHIDIRIGEPSL